MCRNGAARSIAVMTTTIRAGATARWSVVAYGALCYLAFLASFGYAVLFVLGIVVPRTVACSPVSLTPSKASSDYGYP